MVYINIWNMINRINVSLILSCSFWLILATACSQTESVADLRTLSAQDMYPLALEQAQQWKPDVYLDSIDVQVVPSLDTSVSIMIAFGFESPSEEYHSLLVFYRESSGEFENRVVEHTSPIEIRTPIEPDDWLIDSLEALSISQVQGGNEYLVSHDLNNTRMALYLQRQPRDAPLRWRASYSDLDGNEYIRIRMDPKTGKVMEIEKQPSD